MKILIYNTYNEKMTEEIRHTISVYKNCQIIPAKNYNTFKKEFSLCLSGETIVVFFIKNEKDMNFLESIQGSFLDIKLIVNLTESEISFQSRILKLQPRIITDSDKNSILLTGTIQGMIKEKQKNQPDKI